MHPLSSKLRKGFLSITILVSAARLCPQGASFGDVGGWKLAAPAAVRTSDYTSPEIQGYASDTSVNVGRSIDLMLSAEPAVAVKVQVYRMGWYRGRGAALFHETSVQVAPQPVPLPQPVTGLVECRWSPTLTIAIPAWWPSGVFLAKLTRQDTGAQSYVHFVVTDVERPSDILFQCSVTTYQAYNNWGGKSLYPFNSAAGQRARKVSFDRPYASAGEARGGLGAGEFLTVTHAPYIAAWEYSALRWLESEGYRVSYCTNVDIHRDGPRFLANRKAFLSVGHDEYWSKEMRDAIEAARDRGLHLAFLGANTCYWRVRMETSTQGFTDRVIACAKDPIADPETIQWRQHNPPRPEVSLIGVMYTASPAVEDMIILDPAHWAFAGTGARAGTSLPCLVGYEFDRTFADSSLFAPFLPPALRVLTRSPALASVSESSIYTKGTATVFATGSIQWSWGLDSTLTTGFGRPGWFTFGSVNHYTSAGFMGAVAAVLDADQRLRVFARAMDGRVYFARQLVRNGAWSPWLRMSDWAGLRAIAAGPPRVTRDPSGRISVVVRDQGGTIWLARTPLLADETPFGLWDLAFALPGTGAGNPSACTDAAGRLVVAARGADGRVSVWKEPQSGSWSPPVPIAGPVAGDPTPLVHFDGRMFLFARGTAGDVVVSAQAAPGGAYGAWSSQGEQILGDPMAARCADGAQALFFRGADSSLRTCRERDGTFGSSSPIFQGIGSELCVTPDAGGLLHVFGTTDDGPLSEVVHVGQLDGDCYRFDPPEKLGCPGSTLEPPAAAVQADGKLNVFRVAGPSGTFYRNTQLAAGGAFNAGDMTHPIAQQVMRNVFAAMGVKP